MIRFSRVARFLAAPLAFLTLTGLYHRGVQSTIEFPDGWSAVIPREDNIVEVHNEVAGVLCNAQTNFMPSLKGSTLADLNASYSYIFGASDWSSLIDVPADSIAVSNSERRPFGDAFYQVATLTVDAGAIVETEVKIRFGVYILPDRLTMAACFAPATDFAAWEGVFTATVDSLRPW